MKRQGSEELLEVANGLVVGVELLLVALQLLEVLLSNLLGHLLLVALHGDLLVQLLHEVLQLGISLVDSRDLQVDVDEAHHLDEHGHVLVHEGLQTALGLRLSGSDHLGDATSDEGLDDGGLLFEHLLEGRVGDLDKDVGVGALGQVEGGELGPELGDDALQLDHVLLHVVLGEGDQLGRVGSDADGLRGLSLPVRKSLEELFGQKGHGRVEHPEAGVEAHVEGVEGRLLGLGVLRLHDGLDGLDVEVGELLEPEVVEPLHHVAEVVVVEALIGLLDQLAQLGDYPLVGKREFESLYALGLGLEVLAEVGEGELVDVPELVAEVAVADDSLDVEVDVALDHVVEQAEAQGISAALGDSVGELLGLLHHCLLDLRLGQVRVVQFLEQHVQVAAVDDLQRVDHVSLRLRHLAALLVSHHGVQEDGVERQLVGQLETHHHHSGHPEEEDVVAGFEQVAREEGLEVVLVAVGPAEGREREEARGEPGVENVLVLNQLDLGGFDVELLSSG
mmetsp:Transcript_17815/g.30196  ORF Transcript_17815/g.30196 Transcript_17815/m.30196 type:complete len:506 (-) Transcript_17815:1701-3218(-)